MSRPASLARIDSIVESWRSRRWWLPSPMEPGRQRGQRRVQKSWLGRSSNTFLTHLIQDEWIIA